MKRKHFILALVAMLWSFSFSTFATTVTTEAELKEALTAGGEVTLGADINVTETIVVLNDVTATLDLNGHAITSGYQTGSETKHIYPLDVYGNLTIKDTKGDGSITGRGIFVKTGGKLTVDGGSIYGIDANGGSALYQYGGDIVINGGHIEQKATGTSNFAVYAGGGTVKVYGGWVGGNHGAISALGDAEVTIYDGTFVCTGTAGMTDNVLYTSDTGNGSITIYGGKFIGDGDSASGGCCVCDLAGGATINGGSFSNSSGGDVWGTTGTTIKGGTFENLTETQHVAVGATITNGGKTYTKAEDGTMEETTFVAKIGSTTYATLAEAAAAAKAGDEIVLLGDVTLTEIVTLPAGITFNGNGKFVDGEVWAAGNLTFVGHTKVAIFNAGYNKPVITIGEGACLETSSGRMVIGHGATFNITGNIENAKTADVAALTPSLIMPGASFTGASVTFNVTNAYIKTTASYCSSSKTASGIFDFNIENSIWEQFGKLAFEAQSVNATVNFDLKNSVLNTTSHLVFGVSRGEVVIDNSNVNVGTSRQIENQSTMTIKNGSVVNGAVATSSNAKNPGTIIVENATYAVTGEFSGSDLGTGTLIVKKGATVSAGSITKANIQIDATGMAAGDEVNLTADLSKFAGTIEVVNNANLDASIVDGKVLLAAKPVAKIGEQKFATLQEALDAAAAGTGNVTVSILADVNLTDVDWNPVTVSAPGYPVVTVEGNGKTITGLNDMLFAGTWAGKSGLIIKNLTIANSAIVNDKDDTQGTVGVGAFIGYPQASATITLENCHLKNSSVEGGHWTGGLIGMAGGYNGNDGPVFMNLTIKNCSVTESNITGKGSVGGVIGHGSCAAWTNVVIEETTVSNNTITSTGSSNVKAGAVMGTIGAAGQPTTANGETKTGGMSVSAAVAGNTVKSNNTEITTIYGRQGTETGMLYVAGGSYDNYPIEEGVAYAAPAAGYKIEQNTDGTYGVVVDPAYGKVAKIGNVYYESLAEAITAAESGATITLMNGKHELPLFAGKELTFVGESKEGVIVNDAPAAVTQGWLGSTFHFENLTAKGATENYHGLANGVKSVTYKDCNINGLRFLYATEGVSFDGCAFNANGVEHSFWTYGASNVTVKNSTFTYTDRAVNCYSENGANHEADITFEGCSFTYAGTKDAPEGAVEINSGSAKSFDIAFTDCTAPAKGAMWFNSQWDNKNGENTVVSVDGEIVWQVAKGSNSFAYTKEENGYVRVWGEGGGNAIESYELKLYSGETLIATTKLNNIGGIIDGDVYVTWNFFYPESTDEYWTTTWEEGHPNSAAQPTEVELYIDGTLVSTTAAKMSGADDVNPVVWRNLGGVAVADLLGEGTAENPYLIETINDLKFFRDDVNTYTQDGSNQYKGKYVKLTADIDLADENWEPIGKNSNGDHQNFLGTFYGEKADGTKPAISNLYINADGDHLGFFARVGSYAEGFTPTVKNIKFNNVDVSSKTTDGHGGSYVAGVIANAGGNSVVSGIEVTGNVYVEGYGYIGGIVGHGYPDIDNCHVTANDGSYIHSHYWCVGGIIGYAGEGGTPITNSSVSGVDIWSAYGGAAAVAGLLQDGNKLENVSASNVEITSNSDYYMGYIAGNGEASTMTNITVNNVTATAKGNPITPTDAVAQVGDAIYFSFDDALNAATEGTTVKLLVDVALDEVVTIERTLTFDLNGKTVTGADDAIVFNIKAATTIKNGTVKGNKSGTSSGLIDIYANLAMDGVTVETSKINALRFKAGDCTATLDNCNITGAFKGYGGSVWVINSGTYKAASTAINDQLNGSAQVSGGTFHYEITDEECAPGYKVVANTDGTYTVEYAPVCFVDANNNGTLDEGEVVYGSLEAVFNTIKEGDVYVVLTNDVTIASQVDTDADAKYYLNTNVAEGVTVDFAFADDWNYVQKMYVGKGVTLNAPYLLAWTDLEVHGTINTGYLYTTVANVVIAEGAVVNATTGDATVQVKNGATLTVNGELNTSTLNVWVGESKLIVSGKNAKVNAKWIDIWDGTPVVDVENGATLAVENIKASRGGSIEVADATLAATGTIELGHNGESVGTLTETGNSTITGDIKLTVEGSTVKSDGDLTNVTTDLEGYTVVFDAANKQYKVVAIGDVVAKIGESYYETLAAAITAAKANDVITFLKDITEDVTISNSVTIDGADNEYTGTMTGNAGLNVTVQNVNFVNGGFAKTAKSTTGSYTIKDCTFDDAGTYAYALSIKGANTVNVENCTVKNYKYGFLYVSSGTNSVSVKDVTVDNCPSYAVYFSSGVNSAMFENLTVKNSNSGLVINNTANRAFTMKNCKMENVTTAIDHSKGTNTITCTALGVNDLGTAALSQYAVINGATIEGSTLYGSVQGMVEKAEDNQTVKLLSDITMKTSDELASCDGYPSFVHLEGKAVTVDLNGKAITANASAEELAGKMLIGVFSTDRGGELTLVDSSAEGTGSVTLNANDAKVYSLLCNYNPGCKITVNGGTYAADKVHDCLIFSGAQVDALVTINGGNFTLGNVGTGENGKPWIFNVLGAGDNHVLVKGGTFNADINRQHWSNEVYVAKECYTVANTGGTYTVKEGAVAYVNMGMLTGPYFVRKNVGYATLGEAFAAADDDETVTMLKDVTLDETLVVAADKENITLDLAGKTVNAAWDDETAQKHIYAIDNKGNLVIKGNGTINARGIYNYGELTLNGATINAIDANGGYAVQSKDGAKFTMEAGTIATTYEDGDAPGNGYDATTVRVDEGAEFIMNGGEIKNISNFTIAIENYGTTTVKDGKVSSVHSTLANHGTMTIDGGEFTCNGLEGITAQVIWATDGSTTTINGGTFDGKDNYNGFNVNAGAGAEVIITGGNFLKSHSGSLYGDGNIAVSGGFFYEAVPDKYCATDYRSVKVSDGRYTVERFSFDFVDGEFTEYVNDKDVENATITYERASIPTTWTPFYVPFEVPVSQLADKFEVAYINGVRRNDTDNNGELDQFEMEVIYIHGGENCDGSNKILKANYPYFIRTKGSERKDLSIVLEGAILYAATNATFDCTTFTEKFEITGNASQVSINSTDDALVYGVGGGEWTKITIAQDLKPFRFYMTVTNRDDSTPVADAPAAMSIAVRGEEREDGSTFIYDVEMDNEQTVDYIYDLQGRRVLEPQKGGLYIVNGKKVLF